MKNRLSYFIVTALVLFTLVLLSFKKNSINGNIPRNPSPNIIFIIADDMGWDVFGEYPGMNGAKAKTPTLDSLAANGITFTNYWVNPECSPTRAAMLTGRYGFRTGVGGVNPSADMTLKSNEVIIQKYINSQTKNAYATAVIGKWHVSGNAQLNAPESFGVQYFSGFLAGALPGYYSWTETSNGKQQTVTTYTTTHFVNQSIGWIQQQQKPFFLWLALNAPHNPFHRPPLELIGDQALANDATAIRNNPYPYYQASIEAMDKEISRLIASLTAAQKENTVFVFMGDNGTPPRVVQKPFTRTTVKSTLFQGGINTPLIVCGKNITRKNVMETALVQAPDMFATFADIARAGSARYQDGSSMKPLFTNANAAKRGFIYSELFGSAQTNNDGYAIRNQHYKFIHLQSGTEYLFNISIDPFESNNLLKDSLTAEAAQNLNQLRQLKAGFQ
jgi:arylsulfatase B